MTISIAVDNYNPSHPYDTARVEFCRATLVNYVSYPDNQSEVSFCPAGAVPNSDSIDGSPRRSIPYVKALLASNIGWATPGSFSRVTNGNPNWIGFINSDTLVTQRFFDAFQGLGDENLVVVRVWEIPYIPPSGVLGSWVIEQATARHSLESIDGLFLRLSIFPFFMETYPDYILFEEWDRGLVEWIRRYRSKGVKPYIMDNAECLHISHERPWKDRPDDPVVTYNKKLLEEFRAEKDK